MEIQLVSINIIFFCMYECTSNIITTITMIIFNITIIVIRIFPEVVQLFTIVLVN